MADAPPADGEIFKYDGAIVSQMNRLEDRITKFALQNYTTSGAVFLAYFGTKIPLWAALAVLVVLNANFVLAIAHTAYRYKLLYSMHHVTRNCWLAQKSRGELLSALTADPSSNQVLVAATPSFKRFQNQLELKHPAVFANLLPALAGVLLLFV